MNPVPITYELMELALAEMRERVRAYRLMGLATDCTDGDLTREQRQLIGVLGELALRVFCGKYAVFELAELTRGVKFGRGLDGGVDYWHNGKTIQIMTSASPRCEYCYHPEFKPLKAHWIVQASWDPGPREVRLLGAITRRRFAALKFPRQVGSKMFESVRVDQMLEPEAIL